MWLGQLIAPHLAGERWPTQLAIGVGLLAAIAWVPVAGTITLFAVWLIGPGAALTVVYPLLAAARPTPPPVMRHGMTVRGGPSGPPFPRPAGGGKPPISSVQARIFKLNGVYTSDRSSIGSRTYRTSPWSAFNSTTVTGKSRLDGSGLSIILVFNTPSRIAPLMISLTSCRS